MSLADLLDGDCLDFKWLSIAFSMSNTSENPQVSIIIMKTLQLVAPQNRSDSSAPTRTFASPHSPLGPCHHVVLQPAMADAGGWRAEHERPPGEGRETSHR